MHKVFRFFKMFTQCITTLWSFTNSEAASLFIPPSHFSRGSASPAISSSYLKLCVNRGGKPPCSVNRGGKPPVHSSAGFVGSQEKVVLCTKGCAWRLDVFRLICILQNVFYEWRHPHARKSSRLSQVVYSSCYGQKVRLKVSSHIGARHGKVPKCEYYWEKVVSVHPYY